MIDAEHKQEIWTPTEVYASTPVTSATITFAPISRINGSSSVGTIDFSMGTNSSLLAAIAA